MAHDGKDDAAKPATHLLSERWVRACVDGDDLPSMVVTPADVRVATRAINALLEPRYSMVLEVAKVLGIGTRKYSRDGWRTVPNAVERYKAAYARHVAHWVLGEESDAESGLPHLAHAACCLMFLWELMPCD